MTRRVRIEKVEPLSHNWVKLDRYTIRYIRQDGTEDTLVREVHDHGHGASVLPFDAQRGTVLLVRQFRLPAHLAEGGDGFIIEACAGLLDGGADGRKRGLRVLHDVCKEEERARAAERGQALVKRPPGLVRLKRGLVADVGKDEQVGGLH